MKISPLLLFVLLAINNFAASPSFQQLTNPPGVAGLISTTTTNALNVPDVVFETNGVVYFNGITTNFGSFTLAMQGIGNMFPFSGNWTQSGVRKVFRAASYSLTNTIYLTNHQHWVGAGKRSTRIVWCGPTNSDMIIMTGTKSAGNTSSNYNFICSDMCFLAATNGLCHLLNLTNDTLEITSCGFYGPNGGVGDLSDDWLHYDSGVVGIIDLSENKSIFINCDFGALADGAIGMMQHGVFQGCSFGSIGVNNSSYGNLWPTGKMEHAGAGIWVPTTIAIEEGTIEDCHFYKCWIPYHVGHPFICVGGVIEKCINPIALTTEDSEYGPYQCLGSDASSIPVIVDPNTFEITQDVATSAIYAGAGTESGALYYDFALIAVNPQEYQVNGSGNPSWEIGSGHAGGFGSNPVSVEIVGEQSGTSFPLSFDAVGSYGGVSMSFKAAAAIDLKSTVTTNSGNFVVKGTISGNGSGLTNCSTTYFTNFVSGARLVNNSPYSLTITVPAFASSPATTLGYAEADALLQPNGAGAFIPVATVRSLVG